MSVCYRVSNYLITLLKYVVHYIHMCYSYIITSQRVKSTRFATDLGIEAFGLRHFRYSLRFRPYASAVGLGLRRHWA